MVLFDQHHYSGIGILRRSKINDSRSNNKPENLEEQKGSRLSEPLPKEVQWNFSVSWSQTACSETLIDFPTSSRSGGVKTIPRRLRQRTSKTH